MQQRLQYGEQSIPYRVAISPEVSGRVRIHLRPNGDVRVDAPPDTSLAEIKRAVTRRAGWLSTQLDQIKSQSTHVLPREYVSGESHFYLGRRHLLKIRRSKTEPPSVKLRQGRFEIITDGGSTEVRAQLWAWYRLRALSVFDERLTQITRNVVWVKQKPEWRLLTMRRQWGSCSAQGALILNSHLIKAPSACIDYVLLHELCHLKVHNHSPKFYTLLEREMPRWHGVKQRLDGLAQQLLNG